MANATARDANRLTHRFAKAHSMCPVWADVEFGISTDAASSAPIRYRRIETHSRSCPVATIAPTGLD